MVMRIPIDNGIPIESHSYPIESKKIITDKIITEPVVEHGSILSDPLTTPSGPTWSEDSSGDASDAADGEWRPIKGSKPELEGNGEDLAN